MAQPVVAEGDDVHTAPHDELIEVVRELMAGSPAGVSLDQLANALREHGFRRTPGSPRLITRLKRIKEIEVSRSGMIRVVDGSASEYLPASIDPDEPADETSTAEGDTPAAEAAPTGERRRRRRRGGRRRRGRRGGGGGSAADGVVAAASTTSDVPPIEL